MGREAAESLHRPDAAATADAAAILIERSGCARLFPSGRRSRREAPRALIPPPPSLSSPPALPPPPPHTRRTPHTPPRPARRPPFPLPSSLPALGPPLRALAHPAQPGSLSAAGREARSQRGRGGRLGDSKKMAEQRAGRGCAASPTAATPRARRTSERRVASTAFSPAPALRHFNSGSPRGTW